MNELASHAKFRILQTFALLAIACVSVSLLATPYYHFAIFPALAFGLLLWLGHKPEVGYYLIVFLIPYAAYRTFGPYKFLSIPWAIAFWLIVLSFVQIVIEKRIRPELKSHLWPLLIIYYVVNILSTLLSSNWPSSFYNLGLLLVTYLFIALGLLYISPNGLKRTLPIIIVASVSISTLLAVAGTVLNLPFFAVGTAGSGMRRATGGAIDANNFSLMIIFTLPLLTHYALFSKRTLWTWGSVGCIILGVSALVFTYSRGGAIALLIMMMFLFVKLAPRFRPRYLGFALAALALVVLAVALWVPSSYWERQESVVDTTTRSIGRRISYLFVGLAAFQEHPLLGAGPGAFREIYAESPQARHFARVEKDYMRYAHNTYMEVLVGSGLLGFSVFLLILWRTFMDFLIAKRRYLQAGETRIADLIGSFQLSFISVLIYLLMFSDMYHKYLLLSLAVSQVSLRASEDVTSS